MISGSKEASYGKEQIYIIYNLHVPANAYFTQTKMLRWSKVVFSGLVCEQENVWNPKAWEK